MQSFSRIFDTKYDEAWHDCTFKFSNSHLLWSTGRNGVYIIVENDKKKTENKLENKLEKSQIIILNYPYID